MFEEVAVLVAQSQGARFDLPVDHPLPGILSEDNDVDHRVLVGVLVMVLFSPIRLQARNAEDNGDSLRSDAVEEFGCGEHVGATESDLQITPHPVLTLTLQV